MRKTQAFISKSKFCFLVALVFSFEVLSQTSLYLSEDLIIEKVSDKTYLHISYLETESWGKVPCNGAIIIDDFEAIILDTPVTETAGIQLIRWLRNQNINIKGVIINHHHVDCLGSLELFHDEGIPSFSSSITKSLAEGKGLTAPQVGFLEPFQLPVGELMTVHSFFGPGHAAGNIASYLTEESVLFGGCMIKSLRSGKGNLEDADVDQWPLTVGQIKTAYPEVKVVIPGHGKIGDGELLDYTIRLFSD